MAEKKKQIIRIELSTKILKEDQGFWVDFASHHRPEMLAVSAYYCLLMVPKERTRNKITKSLNCPPY